MSVARLQFIHGRAGFACSTCLLACLPLLMPVDVLAPLSLLLLLFLSLSLPSFFFFSVLLSLVLFLGFVFLCLLVSFVLWLFLCSLSLSPLLSPPLFSSSFLSLFFCGFSLGSSFLSLSLVLLSSSLCFLSLASASPCPWLTDSLTVAWNSCASALMLLLQIS